MKRFLYFLILISLNIKGQVNLNYFNPEISQSNYLNPALFPSCKLIIGIPAINGIDINIAHSGFSFNQAFALENGVYYADIDNAVKEMGRRNYFQMYTDISDIFLGYRLKNRLFIDFSIRERIGTNLFYNKDFILLAIDGNSRFEGETISLKGTGFNLNYYRQYSFGAAYPVDDYLIVGAHLNLLFGKANVVFNPYKTSLYTTEEFNLRIKTKSKLVTSLPIVFEVNDNFELVDQRVDESVSDFLLNRKNKGLSIDMGFEYKYYEDLKIYGSILDLGFIRYKTNTSKYKIEGSHYEDGPDNGDFIDNNYINELISQLNENIDYSLTHDKYYYFLPARIYLGIKKKYSEKLDAGVLYNATVYNKHLRSYLGLHGSYQLGKHIDGMISTSFANRSFKNAGLGLSFDFLPFNFYILTDNILGYFWWQDTKSVNLHFGFNLKFGCYKKEDSNGCGCAWIKEMKRYRSLLK